MKTKDYSIRGGSVNYSDFGAPTSRRRFFAFGIRNGKADDFFRKIEHYRKPAKSVRDVIWELKDIEKGAITDHEWPELKTIKKYMKYYKTGKYGWYILKWNDPAPSFGNIMKTYILHPDAFNGGDTRVISVREALLIMGFNKSFRFPQGLGLGHRYQMIVDAVSPVFSSVAAGIIKEMATEENLN